MLKRPYKSYALRSLRSFRAGAVVLALTVPPLYPSEVRQGPRGEPPMLGGSRDEPAATNPIGGLADALARCQGRLSEEDRWKIAGTIYHESERYGYDPYFILAMIEVESRCTPSAVGFNGGLGLIQIKPETAEEVSRGAGLPWTGERSLNSPVVNVRLGLRYLANLEKRFRDPYLAIAAYNMGPGRIGKMSRWQARQGPYVRKILASYENLLAKADSKT